MGKGKRAISRAFRKATAPLVRGISRPVRKVADPLLKGLEIARGERLSPRRKARLDKAKAFDPFDYASSVEPVRFGLAGRTIGTRQVSEPGKRYSLSNERGRWRKTEKELNKDGALTRKVTRRRSWLHPGGPVTITKIKEIRRG
jgi:hypothetical protein